MKTANQQSGGEKGRDEGLKHEGLSQKSFNADCKIPGVLMVDPENPSEPSNWSGGKKKTPPKSDKNIIKEGQIVTGISIKNPSSFSQSIQMQIISFEALNFELNSVFPMPSDAKRALELFLGNSTSGETFEEMIEKENIPIASLDNNAEVRRKRLLWSSLPAAYSSSLLAYLEDPVVKERLLNVIYREGTASSGFADWHLWCDTRVNGKSNPDATVVINLKDLINLLMKEEWIVRESESVLALGSLTFQMKGSGGKGTAAYHSPQFNMSLSAVKKHYGDKGLLEMFEGSTYEALSKGGALDL